MNKRITAIAGAGLLVIQMLGVGTAFASSQEQSECDFGSNDLEITLGNQPGGGQDDVDLYLDDDGTLFCDAGAGDEEQAVATIESITVEMDDEDSSGTLTVYLDDSTGDAVEWPEFDTFDIDVTTRLTFDGSSVSSNAANDLDITVGSRSLAFSGTEATFSTPALVIYGGDRNDVIDASRAAVRVTVTGGPGKDTLKGGSKNDTLDGEGGLDQIYGGAGNDTIDCGNDSTFDQGWGQGGYDTIRDCYTAAPGSEDDEVRNATIVSYTDLSAGIEWSNDGTGPVTGGAAGDDVIASDPDKVFGSQGNDVIVDAVASLVRGYGGEDAIKVDADAEGGDGDDLVVALDGFSDGPNQLFGNGGGDILRGKKGADFLVGGPGMDQAWGGTGTDTCGAEVTNRCEYLKK